MLQPDWKLAQGQRTAAGLRDWFSAHREYLETHGSVDTAHPAVPTILALYEGGHAFSRRSRRDEPVAGANESRPEAISRAMASELRRNRNTRPSAKTPRGAARLRPPPSPNAICCSWLRGSERTRPAILRPPWSCASSANADARTSERPNWGCPLDCSWEGETRIFWPISGWFASP